MLTVSFDWHGQDLSIGVAKDSSIDISINTLRLVFGQGPFKATESEPFEGNESESFEGAPSDSFEGSESRPFKEGHQPIRKRAFEGQYVHIYAKFKWTRSLNFGQGYILVFMAFKWMLQTLLLLSPPSYSIKVACLQAKERGQKD